jgi:dihydrofolate reductase
MKAILAADANWGIGREGKLLVSIPADMRFFRQMTTGNVVVMGRKTLDSMPGGRPLPNRTNIILTRNTELEVKGATVVHSTDELLETLKAFSSEEIYIIGGAEIYRQMLPYCETIYVTKIDYVYQADAFFPNLDEDPEWKMTEESEEQTYFNLEYTFRIYKRVKKN